MKQFLTVFFLLTLSLASFAQETLITQKGKRWKGFSGRYAPDGIEFITEKKGAKIFKSKDINMIIREDGRFYPFASIHRFNGKNIPITSAKHDAKFVYYQPEKSSKIKKLKADKVFSYHTGKDNETILYRETIYQGDTLTTMRVRSMMEGRQDARIYYQNPYTGLINFGIGLASGGTLNYWGVFIPAAYSGIYSSINPLKSKRKVRLLGPRFLTDNYYRYGFYSRAKGEKLKWSAGGGFTGITIGVGILEYLKKFRPDIIDKIW